MGLLAKTLEQAKTQPKRVERQQPTYNLPIAFVDADGWTWYEHERINEQGRSYPGVTRSDGIEWFSCIQLGVQP